MTVSLRISLSNYFPVRSEFTNSLWLLGENLIRLIIGLLVATQVARYLGPVQFGMLSFALAFVAMFSGIAKMGLDSIVVRELVKERSSTGLILGSAFWIKLLSSWLMFIAVIVTGSVIESATSTFDLIIVITLGYLFQPFEIIDFYFQSLVQSKFSAMARILQIVISAVIKFYLVFAQAPIIVFALIICLEQILLAFLFLVILRRHKSIQFPTFFDFRWCKKLLKNSWPMFLSSIAIMLYMRIDQLMIGQMLNEKAVGLYSAGIFLGEIVFFVPVIAANSTLPVIVNLRLSDPGKYTSHFTKLFSILIWFALLVALTVSYFSEEIILLLYGKTFLAAAHVLKIQIWSGIFVSMGVLSANWLIAENLQIYNFTRTILGAILNIGLNILFIPKFGIEGAAWATVASYAFTGFLFDLLVKRLRPCFKMKVQSLFFRWK